LFQAFTEGFQKGIVLFSLSPFGWHCVLNKEKYRESEKAKIRKENF
jgi:hypothetical protein